MKEKEEKRIIKRYRNRKLYDTEDSSYVTLEDIADLIREGEDIAVIDNTSGEDLTSVSLAQIILEEEKRKKDSLPINTLLNIVRAGGEAVKGLVEKSFGDNAKEIYNMKDEMFDYLEGFIKRGSMSKAEGNWLLTNIIHFVDSKVRPTIEGVQNIPSVQNEMRSLRKKLEELEGKLTPKKPGKKG